jgi:RIO kinase 1
MHVPEALLSLADEGIIDEVLRPLKSGKEAQIYMVRADGEVRVAKIYKDAQQRSFKQRAQYTEGRRTRNSRDQRAMQKRTRHGKAQEEGAWKSAEVDAMHRVHAQGVRVPTPYNFIDGVLIMELVRGDDGEPAPRLSELALDRDVARSYFDRLLREVVRMLCAGVVHGDLSDYNILIDASGPVIIDFPQWVDAASNRNAKKLLVRDVNNLSAFLARCAPGARRRPYGQEIWAAYEGNVLTPELELKGQFQPAAKEVDMAALLEAVEEADQDERRRREGSRAAGPPTRRREVVVAPAAKPKGSDGARRRKRGPGKAPAKTKGRGASDQDPPRATDAEAAPKRKRRRRRRGGAKGHGAGPAPQRSEAENGRAPAPSSNESSRQSTGSAKPPSQGSASDAPAPRRRRRRRKRSTAEPAVDEATTPVRDTRTRKRKRSDRTD